MISFAADFTHYGELLTDQYAIGEIRYNATVPEPSTFLLAALAVLGLLAFRFKASRRAGRS